MSDVMDDYPAHLLAEAEALEKRAARCMERAAYKRKLAAMTTIERHTHYEAEIEASGGISIVMNHLLEGVKIAAKEREEN